MITNQHAIHIVSKITTVVLYISYIAVWALIGFIGFIVFSFEWLDSIVHLFGNIIIPLGIIVGVFCFFMPFYLKKFIKFKWLRPTIFVGATIVYVAFCLGAIGGTDAYFSDFTSEKWLKYPEERYHMIEDLKENHGIIGLSYDKIIPLLGEPNIKNERAYTYYCSKGNFSGKWNLEISIENGEIIDIKKFFYE